MAGFQDLRPGSQEWKDWWRDHPGEQGDMIEFARQITRRVATAVASAMGFSGAAKAKKAPAVGPVKKAPAKTPAGKGAKAVARPKAKTPGAAPASQGQDILNLLMYAVTGMGGVTPGEPRGPTPGIMGGAGAGVNAPIAMAGASRGLPNLARGLASIGNPFEGMSPAAMRALGINPNVMNPARAAGASAAGAAGKAGKAARAAPLGTWDKMKPWLKKGVPGLMLGILATMLFKELVSGPAREEGQVNSALAQEPSPELMVQRATVPGQMQDTQMLYQTLLSQMMGGGGRRGLSRFETEV